MINASFLADILLATFADCVVAAVYHAAAQTDYVLTEVMRCDDPAVAAVIKEGRQGRQVQDIISTTWLKECAAAGELLPIM